MRGVFWRHLFIKEAVLMRNCFLIFIRVVSWTADYLLCKPVGIQVRYEWFLVPLSTTQLHTCTVITSNKDQCWGLSISLSQPVVGSTKEVLCDTLLPMRSTSPDGWKRAQSVGRNNESLYPFGNTRPTAEEVQYISSVVLVFNGDLW